MTMVDPDSIDRVAKLLVDAGDVASFGEAEALLRTYRMQLVLDAHACADAASQAAALSIVNTGTRAMHGGVKVFLAEESECQVPFGRGRPLSAVIASVGGKLTDEPESDIATIALGEHEPRGGKAPVLWCSPHGWVAAVSPTPASGPTAAEIPAAVLSGSLAVSEVFQWLRGHAVAGDRALESRYGTQLGRSTVRRSRTCPRRSGCSASDISARPTRGCSACSPTPSKAPARCSCRTTTSSAPRTVRRRCCTATAP